jgi:ubiquinone/menaquinone biosynthesis C-methylase UbiE
MQVLRATIATLLLGLLASFSSQAESLNRLQEPYTYSTPSRDGIGKFYHGREIAQVMGHRGARWLERNTRIFEEAPDLAVQAMDLPADAVVADIGAGTGYFTFRLAAQVSAGQVYAVDIQTEMLDIIRKRMQRRGVDNVVPVLGSTDDPGLPQGVIDAVLLVDAYHEFNHPFEMMRGIVQSLRPGGRVYLIEYRGEDRQLAIKPLHKMTEQQAIREMQAVGLEWVETQAFLPTQHFMVFSKTQESVSEAN